MSKLYFSTRDRVARSSSRRVTVRGYGTDRVSMVVDPDPLDPDGRDEVFFSTTERQADENSAHDEITVVIMSLRKARQFLDRADEILTAAEEKSRRRSRRKR